MIRAAIVGLGWWGKTLVDAVQGKSKEIAFVAGATRTRAKAEDFCKERNIALKDSLDEILADATVDAVVYATPHSMHEEHIEKAAAAGKHVFVEKPFTLDVASAKRALAAVEKAGIVLGIDFQRRFHPNVGDIRARVRDGRLGTICFAEAEGSAPAGRFLPKESWRTNPEETPAGAMTGIGVHLVDAFIDFSGPIDEVYCISTRRAAPLVEDTTAVTLRHRNGALSSLLCSIATPLNWRLAVYGSKGMAEVAGANYDAFRFLPAPDKPGEPPASAPESRETKDVNMLQLALEAFAAAVEGKAPYPIPAEEILHGVAVFEAIVKSAKENRPIKVS